MMQTKSLLSLLVASGCLAVSIYTLFQENSHGTSAATIPERIAPNIPAAPLPQATPSETKRSLLTWTRDEEEAMIADIQKKLQPVELLVDENKVLEPHQALHLHHMKTGGTSVDHLLRCARNRLKNDLGYEVDHFSIHECARGQFRRCVENQDDPCRESMDHAATMSFCSALKYLNGFGWDDSQRIRALTILRHPVDRVWSMYRFETRMCYKCKNLTDVYHLMDTVETPPMYDSLCLAQLQNHQTANLLTSDWPENASDDQIVAEAIENLKSFFTVVGLTEELTLTAQIIGSTFPWVNKTIEGSINRCSLPHDNSSPVNNHCIRTPRTDGHAAYYTSHWDLPARPDEETRKAIEKHNQLDLKVYEAAVQYFGLQKRAFEANEKASGKR